MGEEQRALRRQEEVVLKPYRMSGVGGHSGRSLQKPGVGGHSGQFPALSLICTKKPTPRKDLARTCHSLKLVPPVPLASFMSGMNVACVPGSRRWGHH